jgi:hypothetical protein
MSSEIKSLGSEIQNLWDPDPSFKVGFCEVVEKIKVLIIFQNGTW